MKKKLIGIFLCTLFITTIIIPASGVLIKPGRPVMRQIEGPNNPTKGKGRTWYFEAWDPDGDLMTIYVLWGDNWTDARVAVSNISKSITHIYLQEGNFTITAYAIDQYFEIVEEFPTINYSISLHEGWNLISIPVNQSFYKDNITVNYLGVNYTWNDAVDNGWILNYTYGWNTNHYTYPDNFEPGQGYWMHASVECDLWISSKVINYNGYITDLSIGWNLIGYPFNVSVGLEDLNVLYDDTIYTWSQAVEADIIIPFVFYWNTNIQNYDFAEDLEPGLGYWIYSNNNCKLFKSE